MKLTKELIMEHKTVNALMGEKAKEIGTYFASFLDNKNFLYKSFHLNDEDITINIIEYFGYAGGGFIDTFYLSIDDFLGDYKSVIRNIMISRNKSRIEREEAAARKIEEEEKRRLKELLEKYPLH